MHLTEGQKRLLRTMEAASKALDKKNLASVLKSQCEDYINSEEDEDFDKISITILMISLKLRGEDPNKEDEDLIESIEDVQESLDTVRQWREEMRKKKEE